MSLTLTLKDLYYGMHHGDVRIGNVGSSHFVRAMRVVLSGESHQVREPNPVLAAYSQDHAKALYWRTMLFGDPVALDCLRTNITTFFTPSEVK